MTTKVKTTAQRFPKASPLRESKETGNIVYHPAFGWPAQKNKRTRAEARLPRRGKYHYPKSMLVQPYFCLGGDGTWMEPQFTLNMLGDDKFISPIGALLDQLEAEGHDVKGARVEWLTFRDLAKQYSELFFELAAGSKVSTVASHLYQSSDRRQR